jgi:hypothetical protein
MGGTALGYQARRITTAERDRIFDEIASDFSHYWMRIVQSYRSKDDHGDIDIVAIGNADEIHRAVEGRYLPSATYKNGHSFSFDYQGVQIDLIVESSAARADMLLDYFAWNDLGNFIGRVARSLNFKYGHMGLVYPLRLSDHKTEEIFISSDIVRILDFLGYDPTLWLRGFDTKEDVFEYAASSKFFNAQYFALEAQAHADRIRNKKRKMYQGFLEYIEAKNIQPLPKLTDEERHVHLMRAEALFKTNIRDEIARRQEEYAAMAVLKQKFTGELAREWTGLEGKVLGELVNAFRREVCDEEFLKATTADQVQAAFMDFYSTWSGNDSN